MYRKIISCPECGREVSASTQKCPGCATILIQRRFEIKQILLYGGFGLLVAVVISVLVVPVSMIVILYSLFAKQYLHKTTFEPVDDNSDTSDSKGRIVDL